MITEIINLTSHFDFLWISPHNTFLIYISLETLQQNLSPTKIEREKN